MKLILIPVLASVTIFVSIVYLYTITNPSDQAVIAVKYPFTLSIRPSLMDTRGDTTISFSYNKVGLAKPLKNITVLVVNAKGNIFENTAISPKSLSALRFPDDFGNAEMSEGKHSVLLLANNINQNLSQNFEAVSYPPYILGFFSFMTKDGQALTIGLLISLITVIYQFLTTRNDENKKKRDDKAAWMREKAKEYLKLRAHCTRICGSFAIARNPNGGFGITFNSSSPGSEKRLLYSMVNFYKFYQDFQANTSLYYFDDYYSENFVDEAIGKIYGLYDTIVEKKEVLPVGTERKQRDYLRKFFINPESKNDYSYYDLSANLEFNRYARTIKNWLEEGPPTYNNARKFYAFHFIYKEILSLVVNSAVLVTYSSPSGVKKPLMEEFRRRKDEFKECLHILNSEIYGNDTKLYFRPRFNGKKILKNKYKVLKDWIHRRQRDEFL